MAEAEPNIQILLTQIINETDIIEKKVRLKYIYSTHREILLIKTPLNNEDNLFVPVSFTNHKIINKELIKLNPNAINFLINLFCRLELELKEYVYIIPVIKENIFYNLLRIFYESNTFLLLDDILTNKETILNNIITYYNFNIIIFNKFNYFCIIIKKIFVKILKDVIPDSTDSQLVHSLTDLVSADASGAGDVGGDAGDAGGGGGGASGGGGGGGGGGVSSHLRKLFTPAYFKQEILKKMNRMDYKDFITYLQDKYKTERDNIKNEQVKIELETEVQQITKARYEKQEIRDKQTKQEILAKINKMDYLHFKSYITNNFVSEMKAIENEEVRIDLIAKVKEIKARYAKQEIKDTHAKEKILAKINKMDYLHFKTYITNNFVSEMKAIENEEVRIDLIAKVKEIKTRHAAELARVKTNPLVGGARKPSKSKKARKPSKSKKARKPSKSKKARKTTKSKKARKPSKSKKARKVSKRKGKMSRK